MGTIVQLKRVRIAFIDGLFKPEQYEGKGDFRHSATFIVVPGSDNDKSIQAAIKEEAAKAWPKNPTGMLEDLRGDKKAFSYQKNKKNSAGEVYDGFEDMYALSSIRKAKDGAPLFLHNEKDNDPDSKFYGKPKRLTGDEGVIYAGCYVNAKVEMWAQVGKHSGMRSGLLGVQFCDIGDSFGGSSRPSDDGFDAIDAEDDLA